MRHLWTATVLALGLLGPAASRAHDPEMGRPPWNPYHWERHYRVHQGVGIAGATLCVATLPPAATFGTLALASGGDLGTAIGRLLVGSTGAMALACGSMLHAGSLRGEHVLASEFALPTRADAALSWSLLAGGAAALGGATAIDAYELRDLRIGLAVAGSAALFTSVGLGIARLARNGRGYRYVRTGGASLTVEPWTNGQVVGIRGRF